MKPVVILLFLIAFVTSAAVRPGTSLATTQPDQIPRKFMTPLMRAADAGHLNDVRRLLKAGADVNKKLDGLGLTALMLAARRGHLEIVTVLLKAGADPNAAGGVAHFGFYTPLIMAMNRQNKNRLEVIDALIAAGARLNPPPPFPESPLDAAVKANDIEMISALLKRGSDVNWEDGRGRTALATAVTLGEPNVEVVRLLLNTGADPNKPRLSVGDDCESIMKFLEEQQTMSRNKVTDEITRLIVQAGGKSYTRKSDGEPCKAWTK